MKDAIARDVVNVVGIPGSDTYANLVHARVGLLSNTVLPSYIGLYVAELNRAFMSTSSARIAPDIDQVPAMMAYRRELTKAASESTMLSVSEQRAPLGYPRYNNDDGTADIPVKVEELRLKRLAIEVQSGSVANILAPEDRPALQSPT
jgi:phage portal protein BeeE